MNKLKRVCGLDVHKDIIFSNIKKALIAVARKQLVIIWNVLTKQEEYKEPQIKLSPEQINRKQKYYQEKLIKLQEVIEKAD